MIEKISLEDYVLTDGKILSIFTDIEKKQISILLEIRKQTQNRYSSCKAYIHFENVSEFDAIETFGASGNYSDIVLVKQQDDSVYASFDPIGNSGIPGDQDNYVIKAESCRLEEVQ